MGLTKILKKSSLHILFWFIVWFFFSVFFSTGSKNKNFIFWFSLILSFISIIASYVFVYNLIPNFLINKKHKHFLLYTIYTIVFIVFAVLITVVFGFVFFFNLEYQQMPFITKNTGVILVCVFLIILITSSIKILKENFKSLEDKKNIENKFLQTKLELKEQELKFLKMQIHPHFLFNTLNTLYGFALKKSDKTPDLILKLSNLLDYILYQIDKPKVLLLDEIKHIENYISLEKTRFQDSLIVNINKDLQNIEVEISPMILLPFVENAFKHGVLLKGFLKVDINIKEKDDTLYFTIHNYSKKNQEDFKGIGLENIKKRLNMLYKNNFVLTINQDDNLFKINLKLQLKKNE